MRPPNSNAPKAKRVMARAVLNETSRPNAAKYCVCAANRRSGLHLMMPLQDSGLLQRLGILGTGRLVQKGKGEVGRY